MPAVWRAAAGLVLLLGAPLGAEPLPPALLDAGADAVAARTAVPNETRKVGEVRLVTRGEATVVQTLLATRLVDRVVAEIRAKEERNWPPGAAGRDAMEEYVGALRRVAHALRARRDAGDGDRRVRVLVELVADARAAGVVVGEFEGGEVDGWLAPAARRPIEVLALDRAWVVRNMRLVLADAFDLPERDLARLGPLGPIAPP